MREISKNQQNKMLKKVDRLQLIGNIIYTLQNEQDALAEDIILNLVEDKMSTGDKVLDFALMACNGTYDPTVVCLLYRKMYDLGVKIPGQMLLIVQKAICYIEDGLLVLRNIFLVNLRNEFIEYDVASMTMKLPVERHYFAWREFATGEQFANSYELPDAEWLTVGPILNQYNQSACLNKDSVLLFVPQDAVCEIEFLPTKEPENLFEDYGITLEDLHHYQKTWFREKNKQHK